MQLPDTDLRSIERDSVLRVRETNLCVADPGRAGDESDSDRGKGNPPH